MHSGLLLSRNPSWEGSQGDVPCREAPLLVIQLLQRQGLVVQSVVMRKQIGKGKPVLFLTVSLWKRLLFLGGCQVLFSAGRGVGASASPYSFPTLFSGVSGARALRFWLSHLLQTFVFKLDEHLGRNLKLLRCAGI